MLENCPVAQSPKGGDHARALNLFGRPWRGLFWEEPVLLNRCMVLATVVQLSFRVLAIFL